MYWVTAIVARPRFQRERLIAYRAFDAAGLCHGITSYLSRSPISPSVPRRKSLVSTLEDRNSRINPHQDGGVFLWSCFVTLCEIATLSQAFGDCIAQVTFILGVQTPNVIAFSSKVHHSDISFTFKRSNKIIPAQQSQSADTFVADVAVGVKYYASFRLGHRFLR